MIKVLVSGCAPYLYPTELYEAFFCLSDNSLLHIPPKFPFQSEWGACLSNNIPLNENTEIPVKFCATWLSIIEHKFYITSLKLPVEQMKLVWEQQTLNGNPIFSHIILGMAPFGMYVLWYYGIQKSIIIAIDKAEEVSIEMKDFLPQTSHTSIKEYCTSQIQNLPEVKSNLEKKGLPPHDLFDNYMKQFTYRYLILFEKWDENNDKWDKYRKEDIPPKYEYIEENIYDGTHDKLHDGALLKYHEAGKPKKLAIKWHIKKTEYVAYFWFEDERIREVFDKFYGAHPDTKTDFIIRIDTENKKYELALYRYGLKEPQVIPEDVYQLLVFKNKFEDYRSDNYNQERGAWIW